MDRRAAAIAAFALIAPAACDSPNPATADTACTGYSPADDDPVTRHIAALELADWIDAGKPPGAREPTDVRTLVDKITDKQLSAAAGLAQQACQLHPNSSVLGAVVRAVGKQEIQVPRELRP